VRKGWNLSSVSMLVGQESKTSTLIGVNINSFYHFTINGTTKVLSLQEGVFLPFLDCLVAIYLQYTEPIYGSKITIYGLHIL
jgi:hypothetical protein